MGNEPGNHGSRSAGREAARPVAAMARACTDRWPCRCAGRRVPETSALLVAEPGELQVEAALQPLAGRLADGAAVVKAGKLGVLGGIEIAAQIPLGQAIRLRSTAAVSVRADAPDAGLQAGADPVDHGIWGGVTAGELIKPGQGRLGQAQLGDGFLMAG